MIPSRSALLSIAPLLCCVSAELLLAQDIARRLGELGIEADPVDFHQYMGARFRLDGATAQIVEPRRWAPGEPWIWRARFWGHQPALDLALLKRGYGVAYCDVQNLYGSPPAVARWDAFYEVTQQLKLNPKPILEGMSRGGLIAFNWAKANPTCVSAVYGDNPVCDIRSWPAEHSPQDWRRCLAAYGLPASEAAAFTGNPIDGLRPLVDAGVPVLLVLGEDDRVVPIEENGLELTRRYRSLGGKVHTWIKPGQGHHPHGLDPVTPLLNRLLLASPRTETHNLPPTLLTEKRRILVLGDSITYAGEYVSHFATWAKLSLGVPASRFTNLGLPSETVSGLSEPGHAADRFPRPNLHERLTRVIDQIKPDLIFACYGINCGIYQPYDANRLDAYKAGLTTLRDTATERAIDIVFLTPPIFDSKQRPEQSYYEGVMHSYAAWLLAQQEEGWRVIDLHFAMQESLDAEREINPLFTWQPDSVHPNAAGHRAMATALIRAFAPDFNSDQLDSPAHREQLADTHSELKREQKRLLESTGHRRPGIPGYVAQ